MESPTRATSPVNVGATLLSMRNARRAPREQVAVLAGISFNTLTAYERGAAFTGSTNNLRALVRALGALAPVQPHEAAALRQALGAQALAVPELAEQGTDQPAPTPGSEGAVQQALASMQARAGIIGASIAELLAHAVSIYGHDEVRGLLEGAILSSTLQRASAPAAVRAAALLRPAKPELHVVSAPVQRDGYVEQVVRTVEVADNPSAAKPTGKPTSRKKRA
jgi:transcriptional regulator with XRE-family HTH domain